MNQLNYGFSESQIETWISEYIWKSPGTALQLKKSVIFAQIWSGFIAVLKTFFVHFKLIKLLQKLLLCSFVIFKSNQFVAFIQRRRFEFIWLFHIWMKTCSMDDLCRRVYVWKIVMKPLTLSYSTFANIPLWHIEPITYEVPNHFGSFPTFPFNILKWKT